MKSINIVLKATLTWLAIGLLVGCEKEKTIDQDNQIGIAISVRGIEDTPIERLGDTKRGFESSKVIATSSVQLESGLEAIVSLSEEPINGTSTEFIKSGIQKGVAKSATSSMTHGNTYVVVFYDEDDNHIATVNTTAGTTPYVLKQFKWNTTYKWFAYSFNNSSPITLNSTSTPTIVSIGNSGFLYASGEFKTSNSQAENNLEITFKRKNAIIEVVVDGRGIFDRLIELEMETSVSTGLKSGQFDLKTGKYIPSTFANYTPTFVNSDFTNFRTSSQDTIRKVEMYTVDTVNTISAFSVKFKTIKQPTDLYNKDAARARTYSNVTFNLPVDKRFTPQLGKKYRIVVTPIYRHITVGGVDWAWGDLYYDNNRSAYAFLHSNSNFYNYNTTTGTSTYANSGSTFIPHWNGFWNYKARKPGVGEDIDVVDPCTLVYPKGRWMMPDDFTSINNVVNRISPIPARFSQRSGDPLRYIEVLLNNTAWEPYNWRTSLVFMQVGYRSSTTDNETRTNYTTDVSGTTGMYYWTNASSGSYYYATTTSDFGGNPITSNHAVHSGDNRKYGLRIRCVRNPSFVFEVDL